MMMTMVAVAVLAASPVTMEFDGSLKDGLKQLAQKSGINLVVIGEFDERVQLNLPNVNGEEALETIAQAYGLEVTRSGKESEKMWVVRRAVMAPPVPPGEISVVRSAAAQARELAEKVRERAELLREKAGSVREVAQEAREKAREAAELAREQADGVREAAQEAREKMQEEAEATREHVQEVTEAMKERLQAEQDKAEAQAELERELHQHREEMERHRVSAGGPITIEKGAKVDTAVAYGGPVIVEENAVVEGDAVAFGGDVILKKGAVVEGDAVAFGGNVVQDKDSRIDGESVSMGGAGFGKVMARNMVRSHRSVHGSSDENSNEESSGFGRGFALFLVKFAVFFGLGFVLMMFFPQRLKAVEATIRAEPARNGLVGFLGLLAAIPLTALLVVTLVGIPVALLMWVTLLLFVPVGIAIVANIVGARFPTGRMRKTQALVLAVGLLLLLLVGQIPVLGPMVLGLAVFVSLGAIIRTRFGDRTRGTPIADPLQPISSL